MRRVRSSISRLPAFAAALLAALLLVTRAAAQPDGATLFATHCAACHGSDRLGALGPALLPENLGRLTGARAAAVIADGRPATQMPGFAASLDKVEIASLAAYIASPLSAIPRWGVDEITASRIVHAVPQRRLGPAYD